ncbi:APC family permease [Kitasatospora herbaricolor]|uniref:APC family permease n=1 Tax=Kitasatospora herbaricolor TaxID=68217 RepID=UPI0039A464BD
MGDIVFFVVAAAAPLIVMAGVAPFAIAFGGIGAPVAYLATGLVLALFAVGFTAMTAHVKNAGAFYAYVTRGLGRPAGLGAALLAVFSYNAIQIGMFGAFGYFARTTANDLLGVNLPWPVWALAGVAVVWLLGHRSINLGAKVLGALRIAETGILLVLACAVLAEGGAHGLSLAGLAPANVFQGGMGGVLGLSFAAFVGFEATAIYREEARDPQPLHRRRTGGQPAADRDRAGGLPDRGVPRPAAAGAPAGGVRPTGDHRGRRRRPGGLRPAGGGPRAAAGRAASPGPPTPLRALTRSARPPCAVTPPG